MMRSAGLFAMAALVAAAAPDVPRRVLKRAACVRPSPQQAAWQELETIAFAHFGINTFTGKEWGDGTEDPRLFDPAEFDARQWARSFKDAGLGMIILTCKHHDGFCLWPSKHTEHSVKNSPWKGGRGDVVREVAEACREYGLKFGIYLSPWDRNAKSYGTEAYNDYYKKQLEELLTGYGEITEVWWDGACGEGPNGRRQVYDWRGYTEVVRRLAPKAVIFGMGPDLRRVGNEDGLARESEWSVLPEKPPGDQTAKDLGDRKYLSGTKKLVWYPAECDVSIRPGWFYRAEEDGQVKTLAQLLDIYYRSVGRNSVLLLNIPPDRRGLFHENDVARLKELRSVIEETFRTNLAEGKPVVADKTREGSSASAVTDGRGDTCWLAPDGAAKASFEVDLGGPVLFDRAMLQEMISEGQRVERFMVEALAAGRWTEVARATTIGYKRLLRFPGVTADRVRVTILESRDSPAIREFGLYRSSSREASPPDRR